MAGHTRQAVAALVENAYPEKMQPLLVRGRLFGDCEVNLLDQSLKWRSYLYLQPGDPPG